MLKLNSSHLVEGQVMSTASEVLSSNQILPIPQQQDKIYNQGNYQTFASLGDNFDSQVTSSGSNFKASHDAFSIEDILNEVPLQVFKSLLYLS